MLPLLFLDIDEDEQTDMSKKLFYSYIHQTKGTGNNSFVPSKLIFSYWDSLIFDVNHRTIWHNGMPFGNVYPGTMSYGEIFNDLENNVGYGAYSHAEGQLTYASGQASHAEGYSSKTYDSATYSHVEGLNTWTKGKNSHAEGESTYTFGRSTHAEGIYTYANANYSHAEGNTTTSNGESSHAEGINTNSQGIGSHAEGISTTSEGNYSHSEGISTTSEGVGSHVEGNNNHSQGDYSHAEGSSNQSVGDNSHAEGNNNSTQGKNSHVEGYGNQSGTSGFASHLEGIVNYSNSISSHSEGTYNYISNNANNSHIEGSYNFIDDNSKNSHVEGTYSYVDSSANGAHAEGISTYARGNGSHSEGISTYAIGEYSHVEGNSNSAYKGNSHVEGKRNISKAESTHIEGEDNTITETGFISHVEGSSNTSDALYSHVEGRLNGSNGENSHVEGLRSLSYGTVNHIEGYHNISYSEYSHVEGANNTISKNANYSHAEGNNNTVQASSVHVGGNNNIVQSTATTGFVHGDNLIIKNQNEVSFGHHNYCYLNPSDSNYDTIFSVGYGTSVKKSNAFDIRKSGIGYFYAGIYSWDDVDNNQRCAYEICMPHLEKLATMTYVARNSAGRRNFLPLDGNHKPTLIGAEYFNNYGQDNLTPNLAYGNYSHAEGMMSYVHANSTAGHAEGIGTETRNSGEHASGRYNKSTIGSTLFSVGDGTDVTEQNRKNAFEIKYLRNAPNGIAFVDDKPIVTSEVNGTGATYLWKGNYSQYVDTNKNDNTLYFIDDDGGANRNELITEARFKELSDQLLQKVQTLIQNTEVLLNANQKMGGDGKSLFANKEYQSANVKYVWSGTKAQYNKIPSDLQNSSDIIFIISNSSAK